MNVAILALTNAWGGAERHAAALAGAVAARGSKVKIVCLDEQTYHLYNERSDDAVELVALFAPKEWWRMDFFDWLRLFRGQRWDVCVFIKGAFNSGGWPLDFALRYLFTNYLTLEQLNAQPMPAKMSRRHFGFMPGVGLWWYKARFRGFLRSIAPRRVVCVSEQGRKQLIADFGFPVRKIATVHNGIDTQRFRRSPEHSDAWRRRWGIPATALIFGAVGRFNAVKGYDIVVESFQALLKHFPEKDVRLVLVGEGPQESELQTLAGQIVPRGRVVFQPFCDAPWEPLSAIDVFVMPSRNEGLPLALTEAMACGCCPIATGVGGVPEVVNSPVLGWLVPPSDVDAFTAAMIDAASQPVEQLAAMGARARAHVVANFNSVTQFAALADIIESLVPTSMSAPRHRNCAAESQLNFK